MQKRTIIAIAMGLPLFLLMVLTAVCLGASRPVVALQPEPARQAQDSVTLTGTLPLTETESFTVHLPLVLQDCLTGFIEDFSDPSSGWPDHNNSGYQDGVYRVGDTSGTFQFYGASRDEGLPNDFTLRTEAWSDNAEGAFGLVFGIKQIESEGDIHWESWYNFVIEPASQTYWLDRWEVFGSEYGGNLAYGTSPAILQSAGAHQQLEVQRRGSAIKLIVNGVQVDMVDTFRTVPFEDRRAAGVGIQVTFPTMHAPPTGFFDNFEVIASGCISPQAAERWGQCGH